MRLMPLAFLVAFVLALASGGCGGDVTGMPGDDTSIPGAETGADSVSQPHVVRCTLGETVGLGSSLDWDAPVAGTDDGYAVTYRQAGGWDPVVLTIDSNGDATGPATILPSSDWAPFITSNADGYAIKSGGVSGSNTGSVYRMSQEGSVDSVVRGFNPGGSIDLAETKLRGFVLAYDASCVMQGPWPWRISVGTLRDDSGVDELRTGPCLTDGGGWWHGGFAAHDDSAIMMTYENRRVEEEISFSKVVVNVFTDGGGLERIVLDEGYIDRGDRWRIANVISTVATEDGYAVLWHRQVYDIVGVWQESWRLTFIGEDGTFRGTLEVGEYANDLVWNGREFGLVRGDITDSFRTTHFERLDRRGRVVESLELSSNDNNGWSQRIGASGDGFAITYSLREGTRRGVYFTPIACD
jgi:hypothetical protein